MKKQTKLGLVLAAAAVISVSVASLVSARGWVQNGADWYYVDNNNEYVTDTIQSSGNSKFYLGEDGAMMRDYFLEDYNENSYYFGQNGAMVTNTWVAIESSRVDNQDDYIPDNYWYYFQASGKAMKGNSSKVKKTTIDGKKYAFNQYGQMLTGWFGEDGIVVNPDDESNPFSNAMYYAGGDNDGVLRSGWVTYYDGYEGTDDDPETEYTNIYFYFNTSNNKKTGNQEDGAVTKKINGKTYAFTNEGVMLSGWDPYKSNAYSSLRDKVTYFSGEDDGHQVKKGWVYAVPAEDIDSKKYNDDEEVYMYFQASGDITKDMFKKINGKFYVFSRTGVMKTGVILWCAAGTTGVGGHHYHYVSKLDMDYAEGANVAKKGLLQTDSSEWIQVDPKGLIIGVRNNTYTNAAGNVVPNAWRPGEIRVGHDELKMHLYGSDGARKTGSNNVEFSDDTYTLNTTGASGDKGSGTFSKKYYSLGILLKASSDIRYGVYTTATYNDAFYGGDNTGNAQARNSTHTFAGPFVAQSVDGRDTSNWNYNLYNNHYEVLTTSGARQKGADGAKKDADGNYWLVQKGTNRLKGIWTVNVHSKKNFGSGFTTRTVQNTNIVATTTCTYDDLAAVGLAVPGNPGSYTEAADITASRWTSHVNVNSNGSETIYFTLNAGNNYAAYQSDYRDGSNKWIPMGLTDNSNKTVVCDNTYTDAQWGEAAHGYDVVPTNDYFLNCYWYSANEPDTAIGTVDA